MHHSFLDILRSFTGKDIMSYFNHLKKKLSVNQHTTHSFDYVDYSSRFPLDKMLRTSDEDPISDKRFDAGYVRESPYDYIDYPRTYTGFLPPKRHLPELPLDDMALTSDPAVFLSNLLESASKGDPQSADIINALLNMKSQLSEERDLKTYLEDLSGKDEPMMTGELPPRGISQNAAPFGVNDPLSQASNEDNGSLNRIPAERRQKEPKLTVHESVNKLQFTRPKPTPAIPLAEKQKKKA